MTGMEFVKNNEVKTTTHRKVYFVIMQIKDLINLAESLIVYR